MIRFVVLFCLATGAVLEAALAPYSGKGTGELSLLRQVWDRLESGDILLGDTAYCSYFEIAMLTRRGVDVVLHKHQSRTTDFRTGRRLGHGDHVIEWQKPSRPEWMDKASYDELPATLTVREVRIKVSCPGFRVKSYEVITTLLDTCEFSATELGELYRRRWAAELNLRALKSSMGMDQLRCKSPSMVRKELWIYLLAYNLVRGVLAESAAHVGKSPRQLSFAGAMQSMMTFAPLLSWSGGGRSVDFRAVVEGGGHTHCGQPPRSGRTACGQATPQSLCSTRRTTKTCKTKAFTVCLMVRKCHSAMSLSILLERIAGKQRQREQTRVNNFRSLVQVIAAGKEPDADHVDRVLASAGKTLADLKTAVEQYQHRVELRARLDALPKLEAEQREILKQIEKANAVLTEAEDRHSEAV